MARTVVILVAGTVANQAACVGATPASSALPQVVAKTPNPRSIHLIIVFVSKAFLGICITFLHVVGEIRGLGRIRGVRRGGSDDCRVDVFAIDVIARLIPERDNAQGR